MGERRRAKRSLFCYIEVLNRCFNQPVPLQLILMGGLFNKEKELIGLLKNLCFYKKNGNVLKECIKRT